MRPILTHVNRSTNRAANIDKIALVLLDPLVDHRLGPPAEPHEVELRTEATLNRPGHHFPFFGTGPDRCT